ncbi:MAG: kinase/pyrophosphorylase, partial [Pseudomonadota bacterium]
VVALTTNPMRLVEIRRSRLHHFDARAPGAVQEYADVDYVKTEVASARKFFNRMGWPIVDVSRKSIEETAAAILGHWADDGRPMRL